MHVGSGSPEPHRQAGHHQDTAELLWQGQVKWLSHLFVIIPIDLTRFLAVPWPGSVRYFLVNKCLFLQGACLRANPPKSGAGHKESDGGSGEVCQGGVAAFIRCAACVSRLCWMLKPSSSNSLSKLVWQGVRGGCQRERFGPWCRETLEVAALEKGALGGSACSVLNPACCNSG